MNRVFKSKWSVAHQEYVVTDENHRSRGKAAKSAVALAVTALMLGAGAASAAYVDPGFVAKNSSQFAEAVTSWETPEYQKDWGSLSSACPCRDRRLPCALLPAVLY